MAGVYSDSWCQSIMRSERSFPRSLRLVDRLQTETAEFRLVSCSGTWPPYYDALTVIMTH